jgi:hypothetical protein
MQRLRSGDAFPGIVRDDTAVFLIAQQNGLNVLRFEIALSPPSFQIFQRKLAAESRHSKYSYGFPDGDGECNCTTWIERLGLPLLTGRMDEFTAVAGVIAQVRKQSRQPKISLETQLGLLAMQFRSTRDESERNKVVAAYKQVVDKLIGSGKWEVMPTFEDMLPDERMPKAFFKFWSIPVPHQPDGQKRNR